MKYRQFVPFFLCLLGLAVAEMVVVHLMVMGATLEHVPADQATLDYLEKRKQPIDWNIPDEQLTATATTGAEAKRKLLEKYPGLAFKGDTTPDERNAYDPIRRKRERQRDSGRTMQAMQANNQPNRALAKLAGHIQPGALRALLAEPEYGGVMEKIEHFSWLETPSSAEEASERFKGFSQKGGTDCVIALMNKALLAAHDKDEPEALRLVESAIRLSSHFDLMEDPVESMFVLYRREVIQDMSLKGFLQRIGSDADLPRWREVLATIPAPSASAWAGHLRGTWHDHADRVLSASLAPANSAYAASLASDLRHFSSQWETLIRLTEEGSPGVLHAWTTTQAPKRYRGEKGFPRLLSRGNGYTRALAGRVRTLAALDLLILEKSGTTLDAASMERINTGLLASESPRLDPATRQLSFDPAIEAQLHLTPVKLPW